MNRRTVSSVLGLIAILGFTVMFATRADARGIVLTHDGKSDYTIVLSKDASPSEKHGAQELQTFLAQISGATLPIITEGDRIVGKMIVIGDGDTLRSLGVTIDFKSLGDEGFAIETSEPNLIIAGGRLRGTMYGVYTFLEDVLGCRWYAVNVSHIPNMPTIRFKPLDIVQKPDFRYRDPSFGSNWDTDWAARNKMNGRHFTLDAEHGSYIELGHWVHSFWELVPPEKYFKDHPEYYALIDGKRVPDTIGRSQLCLTNPDVLRIATETVLGWIESNPDTKDFFVSENDTRDWCECDNCKAVYAEEGGPSGLLLRFVNAIADEVKKNHPDVTIHTLAYLSTETPPKITKPRPNVAVWLCPITECEYHPYETCDFADGVEAGRLDDPGFMRKIRGWHDITNNLYIYHYAFCFAHTPLPLPDLDQLAANIPMYKRYGVQGINIQGAADRDGNVFMADLKGYLLAKLLWDSKTDARKVEVEFLNAYYGKAAGPMLEWLDSLQSQVRERDLHGSCQPEQDSSWRFHRRIAYPFPYLPLMRPWVIAESERLFDKAESLADNPDVLYRVKKSRLWLKYYTINQDVLVASAIGTPDQKAQVLSRAEDYVKECDSYGVKYTSESGTVRENFDKIEAPLKRLMTTEGR